MSVEAAGCRRCRARWPERLPVHDLEGHCSTLARGFVAQTTNAVLTPSLLSWAAHNCLAAQRGSATHPMSPTVHANVSATWR